MGLFDLLKYRKDELGYTLFHDYQETFQKYSWKNQFYANSTLHLIMGQLPNIKNIKIKLTPSTYEDARIHVCYLSPTGSGKGKGAIFVDQLSKMLQLKYQEADELTDNALIGSLQKSEDAEHPWEIDYGWLHHSWGINILSITEATFVLTDRPKATAQNVMTHFQKTMNPVGSSDSLITKKIGFGQPIEIQPQLSLFLTTYPPESLSNIVLHRGFLQRMYLIVNLIPPSKREELLLEKLSRMRNPLQNNDEVETIAKRLRYIDDQYKNISSMTIDADALIVFEKSIRNLFEQIDNVTPFLKEKLAEFITRFLDLEQTLALHYACLSCRKTITAEDAAAAEVEVRYVFEDLISFLEQKIQIPADFHAKFMETKKRVEMTIKDLLVMPKYARSPGWVFRRDVEERLATLYMMTQQTGSSFVQQMLEAKILEARDYKDGTPMVKLR